MEKQEDDDDELQGSDMLVERSTTNNTLGGTASVVERNSSPPDEDPACATPQKATDATAICTTRSVNPFNMLPPYRTLQLPRITIRIMVDVVATLALVLVYEVSAILATDSISQ